jgi:hypothetical protein
VNVVLGDTLDLTRHEAGEAPEHHTS